MYTYTYKKKKKNQNYQFKSALKGPRQFLTTESSLKMVKNASYFPLKYFFVLKIFKFLSEHFDYIEKQLD